MINSRPHYYSDPMDIRDNSFTLGTIVICGGFPVSTIMTVVTDVPYEYAILGFLIAGVGIFVGGCLVAKYCEGCNVSLELGEEKKEIEEAVRRARKALRTVTSWLDKNVYIDSNIWMNEAYDDFWAALAIACEISGKKLSLPNVQLDEMSNVKRRKGVGVTRNYRSRLALRRIEMLQTSSSLQISDMQQEARRGAYADPLLFREMVRCYKEGIPARLLTDDREFRIRLRETLGAIGCDQEVMASPSVINEELHLFGVLEPVFGIDRIDGELIVDDEVRSRYRKVKEKMRSEEFCAWSWPNSLPHGVQNVEF